MTEAIEIAPGVTYRRGQNSDDYCGAHEALVADGYVRHDQLPGVGTNGPSSVSYEADGSRVRRSCSTACRTAGYFRVRPASQRRLWVEMRASEEESFARRGEHLNQCRRESAEQRTLAKSWPFPIWGAQLLERLHDNVDSTIGTPPEAINA